MTSCLRGAPGPFIGRGPTQREVPALGFLHRASSEPKQVPGLPSSPAQRQRTSGFCSPLWTLRPAAFSRGDAVSNKGLVLETRSHCPPQKARRVRACLRATAAGWTPRGQHSVGGRPQMPPRYLACRVQRRSGRCYWWSGRSRTSVCPSASCNTGDQQPGGGARVPPRPPGQATRATGRGTSLFPGRSPRERKCFPRGRRCDRPGAAR